MDEPINEYDSPVIENEDLETLNGFEEMGIEVPMLRILSNEDMATYKKIQFTINRKLLEGESIEAINDYLMEIYKDIDEERMYSHPILVGSPLEEEDTYDPEIKENMVTSDIDDENTTNIDIKPDNINIVINNDRIDNNERKPPIIGQNMAIDEERVGPTMNIGKKGAFQRKQKGIFVGMIIGAIIIMIISSMVFKDEIFSGEDHETQLIADFFISDLEPLSGSLITFSSFDEGEKIHHTWGIFPENFIVVNGSLVTRNITLYFTLKGIYRIDKIISRGSDTTSIFKNIEVSERTIRVDRESYGDISKFDVKGDMTMYDMSGLLPNSEIASYSSVFLEFETDKTNPMETEIGSYVSIGYGPLGEEYYKLLKTSTERLNIHGSFERKDGGRSPITGNIDLTQENHIDIFYKRPIENSLIQSSLITVQLTPGNSITFDIMEDLRVFPSKQRDYSDLNIEDISHDRYFTPGDLGEVNWGYYTLIWNAIEYQRILDIPCIKVDFTLDEYTKRELDIESFKMSMWLSDGYPISLKTIMNITSSTDGLNDYLLNVNQDLTTFDRGELPIIYGLNEYKQDDIRSIEELYPEFSDAFHDDWDMVPKLGIFPCSIPSDFDAEDAVGSFNEDLNYRKYSGSRDQLYSLYTNFSKAKDLTSSYIEQWEISLGQKDDEMAWNETITREHNAGILSRVSKPSLARDDISSILTYSGSEKAVKICLGSVSPDTATSFYGTSEPGDGNSIDPKIMSLGTQSERPYPKLGMINPSITESIDMCYFISYIDGTLEIGLDMENGQISFIRGYSIKRL